MNIHLFTLYTPQLHNKHSFKIVIDCVVPTMGGLMTISNYYYLVIFSR